MLERQKTAEVLRGVLQAAFEAWEATDPRHHTQAELARRCQALRGERCSPQAVNSWLKTGRIDKGWIKYVERVLGRSLGVSASGAELERPTAPTAAETPALYVLQGSAGQASPRHGPRWRRWAEVAADEFADALRLTSPSGFLRLIDTLVEVAATEDDVRRLVRQHIGHAA